MPDGLFIQINPNLLIYLNNGKTVRCILTNKNAQIIIDPSKNRHVTINDLQNISRNCTNGFHDKVKFKISLALELDRWFFSHDLSNSRDNINPYFFPPLPDRPFPSQTQPLSKACNKRKRKHKFICTQLKKNHCN